MIGKMMNERALKRTSQTTMEASLAPKKTFSFALSSDAQHLTD
jgi:hypothetical protein